MKRLIILLVVLFSFVLIPFNANASKNDKITIYLFRGQGCPHCTDFLNFLNNLDGEYADMFELEAYEVWYNSTNSGLMNSIAEFMKKDVGGVPFIIIGEETFTGYGTSYDSDIKSAIKKLYNTSKNKRYDVMEEYKKANPTFNANQYKNTDFKETLESENIEYKEHNKSSNGVSSKAVILWNLLFTVASTSTILLFINAKFKKLNENIKLSTKKTNKTVEK